MLRHDLVVSLRRLVRQRFQTAVGVLVLALGLICFIGANLFVGYVRSYDRHFPAADRMYIVAERVRASGFGFNADTFTTRSDPVVAEYLRLEAPELDAVARLFKTDRLVTVDDRRVSLMVGYAERDFTDIFELEALAGEVRGALAAPRSAVITRGTAEQLFGAADVAGRTLTIAAREPVDVTIAAVVADPPGPSHLQRGLFSQGVVDLFVSWDVQESFEPPLAGGWGRLWVTTYALLPSDGSLGVGELDRRLERIVETRIPPEWRFLEIDLRARPVSAIAAMTAQTDFQGGFGPSIGWVDILSTLQIAAGVLLAVACLNFVNLAVAQASRRALDVGTRKVLGATTLHVLRQDLLQTSIVVLAALVLAIAALVPIGRLLAAPWSASLELPWGEPRFAAFLGAVFFGVSLAAGLYPALLVSAVKRVGASRLGVPGDALARLRTGVVGFQFAVASALVAVAIVLLLQRTELREALVGRLDDQYIGFPAGSAQSIAPDVLGSELARAPGIEGTTAILGPAFQSFAQRRFARVRDREAPSVAVNFVQTDHDYFAVMNVPHLAGRAYARDRDGDYWQQLRSGNPRSLVVDRAAARALGWAQPGAAVGEVVYGPGGDPNEIIGVVESVPTAIRDNGVQGNVFVLSPSTANFRIVRIGKDRLEAGLAHVDEVVKSLFAGASIPTRQFLDQWFDRAYRTFELVNRVLMGLAVLALSISAIGLFGVASYFVNERTREIGIRKCQGATPGGLVRLLLWDLSKPVVVANLCAWPLAAIAVDRYLLLFSERVAITPLPFTLALLATWLLACAAVGACVLRAARMRPADALRC